MKLTRCPHCHRSLRGDYSQSITNLIKRLGITKTKFAEDLGTSRWLVHQWINGKVNPGSDYLDKIRKVFDDEVRPTYEEAEGSAVNSSATQ